MKNNKNEQEKCIICHKRLFLKKKVPISQRKYYVEGAGQLCRHCYEHLYKK